MNQPAQRSDMRLHMPNTARFVDAKRAEWGADHVNACLKRAMAGEPGEFYAIEKGQIIGTPFPAGSEIFEWQAQAILWGSDYAAFMRTPEATRGKD